MINSTIRYVIAIILFYMAILGLSAKTWARDIYTVKSETRAAFSEVNQTKKEISELQGLINIQQTRIDNTQNQLNSLNQQMNEMKEKLSVKEQRLIESQERLNSLSKELDEVWDKKTVQ